MFIDWQLLSKNLGGSLFPVLPGDVIRIYSPAGPSECTVDALPLNYGHTPHFEALFLAMLSSASGIIGMPFMCTVSRITSLSSLISPHPILCSYNCLSVSLPCFAHGEKSAKPTMLSTKMF